MKAIRALPWPALWALAVVALIIAWCVIEAVWDGLRQVPARRRYR